MDNTKLSQNADFLSIALEQMDAGNDDVAKEFVEDVYENLLEEMDDDY